MNRQKKSTPSSKKTQLPPLPPRVVLTLDAESRVLIEKYIRAWERFRAATANSEADE